PRVHAPGAPMPHRAGEARDADDRETHHDRELRLHAEHIDENRDGEDRAAATQEPERQSDERGEAEAENVHAGTYAAAVTVGVSAPAARIVSQSVRALSHSWITKPWRSNRARICSGELPTISSRIGIATLMASSLSTVRRAT